MGAVRIIFAIAAVVSLEAALLFSLGAFVAWDANPARWSTDGRLFIAFLGGLLLPVAVALGTIFGDPRP